MTKPPLTDADYIPLHCHSYFSLLNGVSSPEALVTTAKAHGLSALGLTDTNSLAGAVRFWKAAKALCVYKILLAKSIRANMREILKVKEL